MGFLDLLVEFGVFEIIYLSFLPVGHTHEDIDQMFSRISLWLRHNNVFSRPALTNAIRCAFTFEQSRPTVVHWRTIANIRCYLEPYTNDFAANCTKYRHFRFFRSTAHGGEVWIQCASKMNSAGDGQDPVCFKNEFGEAFNT